MLILGAYIAGVIAAWGYLDKKFILGIFGFTGILTILFYFKIL